MYAQESSGIELLFQITHAEAQEVRLAGDMKLDVVIVGSNPIDIFRFDKRGFTTRPNHEPRQEVLRCGWFGPGARRFGSPSQQRYQA